MSTFDIASGSLQGSYDGVIVSTDLEPDDALCLKVVAPRLQGVPLLVVLGQGSLDKRTMAAEMLASYGIDNAVLVQGKTSAASFPHGVAEAYQDATRMHSSTLHDGGEAAVDVLLSDFVRAHERPFAMLLKPPHEFVSLAPQLLAKMSAALYGSFNLTELRAMLRHDDGIGEAEAYSRQFAMMRSFAALLWIERSESCGRDCVIEPTTCPAAIWQAIDADAGLTRHIQLWNSDTLRSMGAKISRLHDEIDTVVGGAVERMTTVPGAATYEKLLPAIERTDKRIKVLLSIAACGGRQICHADTLLAAALLDDDGSISKFERPCKLELDATESKPSFAPDAASTVAVLIAAAGEHREALVNASFDKLAQALATKL